MSAALKVGGAVVRTLSLEFSSPLDRDGTAGGIQCGCYACSSFGDHGRVRRAEPLPARPSGAPRS